MVIIKFISLVIAIFLTVVNWSLIKSGNGVYALSFLAQAISIATFVFLQFNMFG